MITGATYRKKLIEVDLPLDDINRESAREKSIRHGHPSTLHLWWARRPLAACRAVIFASMVDDPSACPEEFPTEEEQRTERARLHNIISQLVVWENTDENKPENRALLDEARYEIACSVARSRGETAPTDLSEVIRYLGDKALPIYDPFCGGGSIPLEVQRLGLRAVGSDLNPVAVLITKALVELPPTFSNLPPVNPDGDPMGMTVGKGKNQQKIPWKGTAGLASDIRYYGKWMREEAFKRIGHHYPQAKLPDGSEAAVIAWLWTRTITCPNPACMVRMPLMRTFQVSRKTGNLQWIKPIVDTAEKTVTFIVQDTSEGVPKDGTVNRNGATCVACHGTVRLAYVREQARAGNMYEQMTGVVAKGDRRRLFLSPTGEHIQAAANAKPEWQPGGSLPDRALGFRVQAYGFTHWHQLFTKRELLGRSTFSDILLEQVSLELAKDGASTEYANAVRSYLALAISRDANRRSSFNIWDNAGHFVAGVFGRQAIPMVWDFPECNPFSESSGNWTAEVEWIVRVVQQLPTHVHTGEIRQADASSTIDAEHGPIIVTDPPYYDNIGYADLSDFFYVWLRPLLRDIYPSLFAGIQVPKQEEMIASQFRFENPRERFEGLLNRTLMLIREKCSPEFPSSIFYAYKQQEEEREGRTSTGWETMLTALVNAGFEISGTWPMRTEYTSNLKANMNSLASSIVLVCRPRATDARAATRRQFLDALEAELPEALDKLTREGHIAPVDLAQAAIGPGMQIYSRYSRVETISGEQVTVREALAAINRVIAEYDEQAQGDLDGETRFCIGWLRQNGYSEAPYGEAELLAQAMNVSVEELRDSHGLLTASTGSVSLLPEDEYSPQRGARLEGITAWEGCFRMAYHLDPSREDGGGIDGAAVVARAMGSDAESVERLARLLYNHYDRKGGSRHSVMFNNLVTEWSNIMTKAQAPKQGRLGQQGEQA